MSTPVFSVLSDARRTWRSVFEF